MFAIQINDQNQEIVTALNGGVSIPVVVPHAYFVDTAQGTHPYVMDAIDFLTLIEYDNIAPIHCPVWTF